MHYRFTTVLACAAILAACSETEPRAPVDPAERGAALLVPFKAELKNALVTSMQAGVDEAIAACSTAAPGIAASLSVDGVVMGRSSHRLRNPANAAPDWVTPVIDDFLAGQLQPVGVALDDGRRGFVEPIMTQPLCLTCHGQELQPEVAGKIAELYPEDQATGFREGEFRGVFWVEF